MTRTSELKRIDWLMKKSRNGRLTKQEQYELGEVFLQPAREAKKIR